MKAAIAALFLAAEVAAYGPEALQDEITDLPGAPSVEFRMFSGYIDVGEGQMFYWFVESQRDAAHAPVILWTNGGPGCSGLAGFLTEQGPFRVKADGKTLSMNHLAWNKIVNMVFIEQPVGVGFSKTDKEIQYGDHQAAEDNFKFVLGFFKRYPEYKGNDFYISSESYGGHYMPTLGKLLADRDDVPSFRGIFLGNPLTYMMYRDYGQYGTAWGHQLLPGPLWMQYDAAKCATTFPASEACQKVTAEMDKILSGFDVYALGFPTCDHGTAAGQQERLQLMSQVNQAKGDLPPPYQPCASDLGEKYLNLPEVQTAIHAQHTEWGDCSRVVGRHYNSTDLNEPMMPYWQHLIQKGTLNLMIYSGDDDAVCATLGSQQFVWDLGYAPLEGKSWVPWTVQHQTAGFRTEFAVPSKAGASASFSFVTVHGAGHMVPATQPARSLALLRSFLGMEIEDATLLTE
ncbi:Serine carboxypeptidase-like 39 [Symbiodinium microadriaticum]|uniref:Carboxypeptidase n=1 Tax=Symbiodinium microadriaticum TaxID=2951 RepID=A0A1Q9DNF0_SYMMI|nr:Serine carboxypeptidase-like 39 [Symbiodinium microadriaticum]CAE7821408.1 SCPL39 [Symbiodinium microadriaticum]CAE7917456.1 SCPL39 [Symbiodinium sp. KB8]